MRTTSSSSGGGGAPTALFGSETLNVRLCSRLSKNEVDLISGALNSLRPQLPQREAALAAAPALWAQAAWQVWGGSGPPPPKWTRSAALRLGVALDRDAALSLGSRLVPLGSGLPGKIGVIFDHIAPLLYRAGSSRQGHSRKRNGAFLTPYPIARTMVERAFASAGDATPSSILDPGAGTGVFLSAALHVLVEQGLKPREAIGRLRGVEKDAALAEMARLLLGIEAGLSAEEVLAGEGALVWVEDYLVPEPKGKVDSFAPYETIVMNPPYERVAKVDRAGCGDKKEAASYAARIKGSGLYPLAARGSLDTYRLFIERSLKLLAPSGGMAFVVPSSILADKSAAALRKELLTHARLDSIDIYPERAKLFRGVTQEVVIVTLSKSRWVGGAGQEHIKFLKGGSEAVAVPRAKVRGLTPGWELPLLTEGQLELFRQLSAFPHLGNIPGVMARRGELDQSIDKAFLGRGSVRFLRGRHIRRFRASSGERCDLEGFLKGRGSSTKKVHINLPRLAGRQVSNQSAAERLVFAYVSPPAVLGNSLNYVVVDDDKAPEGLTLWALLGILNSAVLDWYFRVINSNNHVGLYELRELPIPVTAGASSLHEIGRLARELARLGGKCSRLTSRLNSAVLGAFGLDSEAVEPLLTKSALWR